MGQLRLFILDWKYHVNLTTKVATVDSGTLPAAATLEGAVVTITGKGSAVI